MTGQRNSEIFRLRFEENLSSAELARIFQMSRAGIMKILKVELARRPDLGPFPADPPPGQTLGEPASRRHRAIGQRVKWWREQERRLGLTEAAMELRMSRHRLRAVEEGCYAQIGLDLMQRLATVLNIDLDEFMSEDELKPPHEWTRPKG